MSKIKHASLNIAPRKRKNNRQSIKTSYKVVAEDETFQITLYRSNRKSLSLQISKNLEIKVRAPHQVPLAEINKFVKSKRQWINKNLKALKSVKPQRELVSIKDGGFIMYKGKMVKIVVNQDTDIYKFRPKINHVKTSLVIRMNTDSYKAHRNSGIRKIIISWLKRMALEYLTEKTFEFSKLINAIPKEVKIYEYKRKWGATFQDNTIKYNWKIIMAPIYVIHYIIMHELSHLTHFSHSKKFWEKVDRFIERRQEAENWLKTYGAQLSF